MRPRSRQRHQLGGLLWSLPYFLAAYASAVLSTGAGPASSIWLPAGVAMAALMLTRPGAWPAVMIGIGCAQTLFGVIHGANLLLSILLAIVAIGAPGIALALVVRLAQVPLHGLYFLRALFLAALIECLLAACANAAVLMADGADFASSLQMRAIAHFVGIFVITPVFTTWARFRPSRQASGGRAELVIGGLAFAALVPTALLVFGASAAEHAGANLTIGLSYVPLLFCALIALLWGARGGVVSVLVLALIALAATASGNGPFTWTPDADSLLGVQLYLGVASVLVLLTTTLRGHRERLRDSATQWRSNMELALAGSGQLVYCLDPRSGRIEWGGDVENLLGRSADTLGTLDQVIAAIDRDDRARARNRWLRATDGNSTGEITFALPMASGRRVFVTDSSRAISDLDDNTAFIAGTWRVPLATDARDPTAVVRETEAA